MLSYKKIKNILAITRSLDNLRLRLTFFFFSIGENEETRTLICSMNILET